MNNYTVSSFDQEKGRIALYDKKNKVMVIIDIASVSLQNRATHIESSMATT